MRRKAREHLEKAHDCAVLAIETYNKPAIRFRTGGYVTLMVIAWTSMFHAHFFQKRIKPFYRKSNGRYEKLPDGDYKYWELSRCLDEYYGSNNNAVRSNAEFFIALRNKIEHRSLPILDLRIFAECQAFLLNFNELLKELFGERFGINESLSFSLQLFPDRQQVTGRMTSDEKSVVGFIDQYRSSLSTDILCDDKYAFRAYLIKVANHKSRDTLAIQFIDYAKLTEQEKQEVDRVVGLVKERRVPVANPDLLRPSDVVMQVQARIGNRKIKRYINSSKTSYRIQDLFTTNTHYYLWRRLNVRPGNKAKEPRKTIEEYCVYDNLSRGYGYTEKWVDRCVEFIQDEERYLSLYSNPSVIEIISENTQQTSAANSVSLRG